MSRVDEGWVGYFGFGNRTLSLGYLRGSDPDEEVPTPSISLYDPRDGNVGPI